MLNRIRRAVSLTRERHSPKGRHRRPLASTGPSRARTHLAPADGPTAILGQRPDHPCRADSPTGEGVALVRPYVLAGEQCGRPRRSVIVASHLPPDAWSLLAGGH